MLPNAKKQTMAIADSGNGGKQELLVAVCGFWARGRGQVFYCGAPLP